MNNPEHHYAGFIASGDAKTANLYIYGVVGREVDSSFIVKEIAAFKGDALNIHIHSAGGSCSDAAAIYNAIKDFKGTKTAKIEGLSGSAASYIMLACDKIEARENAIIFIHNPLVQSATGNAEQLEKMSSDLRKIEADYVCAYIRRTGKSEEEVRAAMDNETLFTASEAKDFGLVDEVIAEANDGKESAKRQFKIVAQFCADKAAMSREPKLKGKIEMKEYTKWSDAIADLEGLAAAIADEETKTELESIIVGLKALETPAEEPEEVPNPEENSDDAEALRISGIQAIVAAHRDNSKDGRLDGIAFDAIANKTSVAEFTVQAVKALGKMGAGEKKFVPNPSAFKPKAEISKEGLLDDYNALKTPKERDEFRRKHGTDIFSK